MASPSSATRPSPTAPTRTRRSIEKVFAELDASRPDGLRYASFRLADGVSFVHVAAVDTDDGTNPLTADRRRSQEFLRDIADRCEEGPVASDATLVGSYRFG